jgi:hypothetical protein
MDRYSFLTDDDAHWYLVESSRQKRFHCLLESGDLDQFEIEFCDNRIGCHPSLYSFTNPTNDMRPQEFASKAKKANGALRAVRLSASARAREQAEPRRGRAERPEPHTPQTEGMEGK